MLATGAEALASEGGLLIVRVLHSHRMNPTAVSQIENQLNRTQRTGVRTGTMKPGLIGSALSSVLLFGCLGDLTSPLGPASNGDPSSVGTAKPDPSDPPPLEYTCDESQLTQAVPLKRLTRAHYESSVRDLISSALPAAQFDAVWAEFAPALQSLPNDSVSKKTPFSTMDATVSQEHVVTYFRAAEAAASVLTASAERVQGLLACADGASGSACIDAFIQRFGRRAFRHTLSNDEAAFLREVYAADDIDAVALHDLIAVMLNAPQFLYHVEFGEKAVADKPDTFELSDSELASRLAYHFWQSPPDEALLDAADRNELSTEEGYEAAVERVMNDPRARAGLDRFLSEWFDARGLRRLDQLVGDKVFDAFVGDDVPSPELNEDMVNDLLDSFAYHVSRGDSFEEWFTSPYSFARDPQLAAIYGVAPYSGEGEPPKFPEGERAGLLTRAAILATPGANTRPIMRGVFIRERLLCDHLAPPPMNANAKAPELSPTDTTREVVEALTEQPATSCIGCHTQINPLGFALEGFDALGRPRDAQKLYSPEGQLMEEKPVDTESIPVVTPGDKEPVAGAGELAERIVDSSKVESCFSKQYLRFALAREADYEKDGCSLEAVRSKLAEGGSMTDAMKALAFRPEFRQRTIGEVP
jgi:hypothetical protein